jgi:hypothetical protein
MRVNDGKMHGNELFLTGKSQEVRISSSAMGSETKDTGSKLRIFDPARIPISRGNVLSTFLRISGSIEKAMRICFATQQRLPHRFTSRNPETGES